MCRKTAQGRRAHALTGHDMLLQCDATNGERTCRYCQKGPDRTPRCDAESDEIEKEEDELYANRSQFFEDRASIQQQLDALFAERRVMCAVLQS